MRSKEDASDYRYFPEPDLLPVEVSQDKIDLIQSSLPELPDQKSCDTLRNWVSMNTMQTSLPPIKQLLIILRN